MRAHTPGPFAVRESESSNYLFEIVAQTRSGKQAVVARVAGGPFAESRRANAHLLAASPLMREALELLVGLPVRYNGNRIEIDCGSHDEAMAIVRKARAAIAAATDDTTGARR